jgi:hypothetical protein
MQGFANDSTRDTSNRVNPLLIWPPVNPGGFLCRHTSETRPAPKTEYRAHASVIPIDTLPDRTYYGRWGFWLGKTSGRLRLEDSNALKGTAQRHGCRVCGKRPVLIQLYQYICRVRIHHDETRD